MRDAGTDVCGLQEAADCRKTGSEEEGIEEGRREKRSRRGAAQ